MSRSNTFLTREESGNTVSRTDRLSFSEVHPGIPKTYFRRRHELQVCILYHALGFWSACSGVAEHSAAGETSHARRWPRHPCPRAPPDRWQGDGALSSLLQGCFD